MYDTYGKRKAVHCLNYILSHVDPNKVNTEELKERIKYLESYPDK
jgi:hemerythrin-like domain-containing protein